MIGTLNQIGEWVECTQGAVTWTVAAVSTLWGPVGAVAYLLPRPLPPLEEAEVLRPLTPPGEDPWGSVVLEPGWSGRGYELKWNWDGYESNSGYYSPEPHRGLLPWGSKYLWGRSLRSQGVPLPPIWVSAVAEGAGRLRYCGYCFESITDPLRADVERCC